MRKEIHIILEVEDKNAFRDTIRLMRTIAEDVLNNQNAGKERYCLIPGRFPGVAKGRAVFTARDAVIPSEVSIPNNIDNEALMLTCVDKLTLSGRARHCLDSAGIYLIGELCQKQEWQMLRYRYLGNTTLDELRKSLNDIGLMFNAILNDDIKRKVNDESIKIIEHLPDDRIDPYGFSLNMGKTIQMIKDEAIQKRMKGGYV